MKGLEMLTRGKITAATLLVVVLLAAAFAACNGDDENQETSGQTPEATELGQQPDTPQELAPEVTRPVDGAIAVEQDDNFFVQNNLAVGLGQTVTVGTRNIGQAIHNLRLAGVDGDYQSDDDLVSNEAGDQPGSSGDFQFTPTIPGTYVFRCDFHPTEMSGVIVVE